MEIHASFLDIDFFIELVGLNLINQTDECENFMCSSLLDLQLQRNRLPGSGKAVCTVTSTEILKGEV